MCFTERFLSCSSEHYVQASYTLLRKSKITVEVGHTVLYRDPDDVVAVTALSVYSEDALFLFHAHVHTHTRTYKHCHKTRHQLVLNHSDICIQSTGTCVTISGEAQPNKTQTVLNLSAVCSRGPSAALLSRSRFPAYWFFFISSCKQAIQRTEAPRHIYLNNFSKTAIRKTIYPAYSTYEWNVCTKKIT